MKVIVLSNPNKSAPELMRRIVALVRNRRQGTGDGVSDQQSEVDPRSVADLYRCRWQIEVFFKQIKQTLQLGRFPGHNANAVRWQVWMALLVYLLLRYLSYLSKWSHSLHAAVHHSAGDTMGKTRFIEVTRIAMGTAKGSFRTWRDRIRRISQGFYETMDSKYPRQEGRNQCGR